MSIFNNNLLAGAGAQSSGGATYSIDQSIRFNPADSTYMQRTHGAGGNVDLFTVSFWFKRNILGGEVYMFGSGANTSNTGDIAFNTSDQLIFWQYIGSFQTRLITTQVFRDTSAWYHVVINYDSGNAVSTERARMYINGERITSFGTETYPSQNQDGVVGSNVAIGFGRYISYGSSNSSQYFPGYLAEMHYVNGSALDPSSFAEYNSSNIWIPKEYSGSYGTGGFYIKGEDSSDLGNDSSGNGNDMTTSGLAAHDQVADSPTNNFAVLNPLDERGSGTLSNGNLQMAFGATNDNVTATQGLNTGKWYWEVYIVDKDDPYVGVQDSGVASTGYTEDAVALWVDGGYIYEDGSDTGDRSTTYVNGDIVGVAFDVDNKKIWWSKNGQWYSADDSSTATINISEVEAGNQAQVITRSPDFFMPFVGNFNTGTVIMNFGQEGTFAGNVTAGGNSDGNGVGNFKYSVPSGYLALCTKNLGS